MSNKLDCRGLACPQPVIMTKKALEALEAGSLTVLVDNPVAKENVAKFASAKQYGVSIDANDNIFSIRITKGETAPAGEAATPAVQAADDVVYLISQDTLGHGNKELGAVLMKSFFYTMTEKTPLPRQILLINSGVLLATEGSPVLDHLRLLAGRGVVVTACGTCLDYLGVKDRLAVGSVGNMYVILDALTAAGRAITL